MSGISENYLHTVIRNVASKLSLLHWSYKKQSFDNISQNYFGVLIPVQLSGKIDEKNVNLSIVLKFAPTDQRYRVSGAVTVMFEKEIFVYSKLLQKYQDLQKSVHISSCYIIPECYYVCKDYCSEVIVMDNMCGKGYHPYVRSKVLDLDHVLVAIKSLAQFHSLSFVLRERDVQLYEESKEFCCPLTEKSNQRYINILIDRLQKALKIFQNSSYTPLLEMLVQNCVMIIESAFTSVKSLCLCHGDIWKENIMFQYENNKPISACILDYQTTRMCSPAFDLLYLIISSTTTVLRKNHFNEMLDVYYHIFEKTLLEFNLDPKQIYSKDCLQYDLKSIGAACFIDVNTAIWLSSGLQQEGHVRSKVIFKTDEEKIEAEETYKEITKGIIDDLTHYGYFTSFLK